MKKFKNGFKMMIGRKTSQRIATVMIFSFVVIDLMLSPLIILFAFYFRILRHRQFKGFPFSRKILFYVGVLPIIDHYHEPMFNHKRHLKRSLRDKRNLPGIDLDVDKQIELLKKFHFNNELRIIPTKRTNNKNEFCHNEGPFPPADAEYLYNIIRYFLPRRVIEIGSGQSTLMVATALNQNKKQITGYICQHICIEPYENPWLEALGVQVIRKPVEECDISLFKQLEANDILFIDSSHVIRPQGDVLYEYLEILPQLASGVLIHIHDIFTPQDYPEEWVFYGNRLWNEQYLLEAFLTHNNDFSVIGSTNLLLYNYYNEFSSVCPVTKELKERGTTVGAGSFWIKKN